MSGRGTAQPGRENCAEDRCSGDFVRASENGTGSATLPKYFAPENPRTALYRGFAPQRHERAASITRSRPGTSISTHVEVRSPSPPTRKDEKRRIQRAAQSCNFFNWLAPTFRYAHTVGAEVPQECVSLMTPTFLSDQFDAMYYVPHIAPGFFAGSAVGI